MGVTNDFKRAFIMRKIKKKDTIALTQHLKGHICVKESANVKANTSQQKHMRYGISGSKIRLFMHQARMKLHYIRDLL